MRSYWNINIVAINFQPFSLGYHVLGKDSLGAAPDGGAALQTQVRVLNVSRSCVRLIWLDLCRESGDQL
ncbi:hypothetical protein J6590_031251 [Homalodisca vitripennis]|nr:hypothetical protein J6590_031251 [Homalodisca vitripennis]